MQQSPWKDFSLRLDEKYHRQFFCCWEIFKNKSARPSMEAGYHGQGTPTYLKNSLICFAQHPASRPRRDQRVSGGSGASPSPSPSARARPADFRRDSPRLASTGASAAASGATAVAGTSGLWSGHQGVEEKGFQKKGGL